MPKSIKLKVPCFRQTKNTCGPTCLRNVFAFWGKNVSLKEILKKVKMFKYGTWTGYLGIAAFKFGFDVKFLYYNANYIDPTWFSLPKGKLLKKLKVMLKKEKIARRKEGLLSLIEFLEAGGRLIFKIPSKESLLKYLKKGIPPIICLCHTILNKCRRKPYGYGETRGHFVVVIGYKNKKFFIADPSRKYGGIREIPEEELLYSWFFWGGDMLIIKPKNYEKK